MSFEFVLPSIEQKRGSSFATGVENDMVKDIYKTNFLSKFYEMNLDIDTICNGKKNKNEQFNKLNLLIKDMYEHHRYFMQDMFTFLEEDLMDTKQVWACFNEENMYELRYELSVKYHVKQNESKIELMMEE